MIWPAGSPHFKSRISHEPVRTGADPKPTWISPLFPAALAVGAGVQHGLVDLGVCRRLAAGGLSGLGSARRSSSGWAFWRVCCCCCRWRGLRDLFLRGRIATLLIAQYRRITTAGSQVPTTCWPACRHTTLFTALYFGINTTTVVQTGDAHFLCYRFASSSCGLALISANVISWHYWGHYTHTHTWRRGNCTWIFYFDRWSSDRENTLSSRHRLWPDRQPAAQCSFEFLREQFRWIGSGSRKSL